MEFTETHPDRETYWRAVVLFGRNVASYKFALAKALLAGLDHQKTIYTLEELAWPFAFEIAQHLRTNDKQGTSGSSKFLDAVRGFNTGSVDKDELIQTTAKLGFNNVLDAFHVVNCETIPIEFFKKLDGKRGISITDEFLSLAESVQQQNLKSEAEARWRLVETAWDLNLPTRLLAVSYDVADGELFIEPSEHRRIGITSSRDALNGYQKGKCFYCFSDISVVSGSANLCEVDHFFPKTLMARLDWTLNLDVVWNLVLACKTCNGAAEKGAKIPKLKYLSRLEKRNNFFILSHHPLRETLINQTGNSPEERHMFLQRIDSEAITRMIHRWETANEQTEYF